MTNGQKLKAISKLTMKDCLSYVDYHDIGHWAASCEAEDYDTTILSEKILERINAIFSMFFSEV